MKGKFKNIYVLLLYLFFTLILTYPAIFRFSTHFMCDEGDGFQNVWNLWWLKTALLELRANPYYTNYLHHPDGVTLLFHTLNPFNGLISIPLQYLFSMEVVYNLIVMFSFVMSGFFMYLLSRYLTNCKPAAFVSGVIFTFSPYHFGHGLGHLQLIAMEWIPFYVLYLLRAFYEGGKKEAILAGVFLILITLCSWYYLIYSLFFTAIFVIYQVFVDKRKVRIENLWLTGLVFFAVLSPLIGAMIYAKLSQQFLGAHNPVVWSADLLSFFVPGGILTFGKPFESIWSKFSGNIAENSNYIGYIVLFFAIYGFLKGKKPRVAAFRKAEEARFFLIAGGLFFLLSLGPYLRVLGKVTKLPLPYLFFHNFIPFFSFTGVPGRFDIMVVFCLAILVSYAIERICANLSSFKKLAFTGVVSVFIMLEYLAIPYTTTQIHVPEFYKKLREDKEEYAIIDIPSRPVTLYFQTIHRKRLIGGYVSRPSKKAIDFLSNTPVINELMLNPKAAKEAKGSGREPLSKQSLQGKKQVAKHIFEQYNIRYVITHTDDKREFIEKTLKLPCVYDAEGIRAYATTF